jgi:hypothetical protein
VEDEDIPDSARKPEVDETMMVRSPNPRRQQRRVKPPTVMPRPTSNRRREGHRLQRRR